ncbi:hypothetical protein CK203_058755 [Vitis vinifera]|uniref:Reverse transcriptase RNase H-like domain-containing protein n=1 Tax=Vitis vinifera TaxID=29760 RepID=A0A438FTL7_VITVI|nr:hypothetical protein CK203_058755 [Vitis vinifera]
METPPPRSKNELQRLTGKLVALGLFIARFTDNCDPSSWCYEKSPLRNILHKSDLSGRMLQWAIELSEYGIEYQPRLSMKGQVMADFMVEYSQKPAQDNEPHKEEWWTLQVDGASRSSGSGVGLLLLSPNGRKTGTSYPAGIPRIEQ